MLVSLTMRRDHELRHEDPDYSTRHGLQPGTPHPLTRSNWPIHSQMFCGSECSGSETLVASNPERVPDPDAKYQNILQQAGIRTKARLDSIIEEYDDKIGACAIEVDGIAMVTQWVGPPILWCRVHRAKAVMRSVSRGNKHGNCGGQRRKLGSDTIYRTGHHGIPPRILLRCEFPINSALL